MNTLLLAAAAYLILGKSSSSAPPPPPNNVQAQPGNNSSQQAWERVGANLLQTAIDAAARALANSQSGGSGDTTVEVNPRN